MRLGGERRTATVLFADLRGSTALAERLQPEQVIAILNTYVGTLARCVFAHEGMLDKYLGDGLMAIFGIVPDPSDGAVHAARTALDMRRAIARLNAERRAAGDPVLEFGVALHTGEVVLGAVGVPQRSDFTAIGDTVNTTARLEGQCRDLRRDILLSAATASRLSGDTFPLADMGEVSIRGKELGLAIATFRDD
jgi:adenylate cyclase